jgi:hypothetical protein
VVQRQVPVRYALEAQTRDDRTEILMQGTVEECQYIHTFILGAMNADADPASWDLGAIVERFRQRPR